jgi:hypothetical protein
MIQLTERNKKIHEDGCNTDPISMHGQTLGQQRSSSTSSNNVSDDSDSSIVSSLTLKGNVDWGSLSPEEKAQTYAMLRKKSTIFAYANINSRVGSPSPSLPPPPPLSLIQQLEYRCFADEFLQFRLSLSRHKLKEFDGMV